MKHSIKVLCAAVAACFSPQIRNAANEFPPKKETAAENKDSETKPIDKAGQPEPGKGTSPDPGTGKTTDYRKMVLSLLGLGDEVDEAAVSEAFNACMSTEPDEDDKVIKGKLDEAMKGKNDAEAGKVAAEGTAAEHAATAHDAIAKLHESTKANEALQVRVTAAETAFANEHNRLAEAHVILAIKDGRLSRAQKDEKLKELANTKTPEEFETGIKNLANMTRRFSVESVTTDLERTIAPGTASEAFQTMVNEAVAADASNRADKWSHHWSAVGKTEKGKALLASMRQPQRIETK